MGDITPHISRSEVACPCGCGLMTADYDLVAIIEETAHHFLLLDPAARRVSVTFNSWCRCPEYDLELQRRIAEDVGLFFDKTESTTQHRFGWATDFWMKYVYNDGTVKKIHDDDIADYLEDKYPALYGIGRYRGRTHLDMRGIMQRWDNR